MQGVHQSLQSSSPRVFEQPSRQSLFYILSTTLKQLWRQEVSPSSSAFEWKCIILSSLASVFELQASSIPTSINILFSFRAEIQHLLSTGVCLRATGVSNQEPSKPLLLQLRKLRKVQQLRVEIRHLLSIGVCLRATGVIIQEPSTSLLLLLQLRKVNSFEWTRTTISSRLHSLNLSSTLQQPSSVYQCLH